MNTQTNFKREILPPPFPKGPAKKKTPKQKPKKNSKTGLCKLEGEISAQMLTVQRFVIAIVTVMIPSPRVWYHNIDCSNSMETKHKVTLLCTA